MKGGYRRRADFDDLPWLIKLGILKTELSEYAESEEEKTNAALALATMETTLRRLEIKMAPEYVDEATFWKRFR